MVLLSRHMFRAKLWLCAAFATSGSGCSDGHLDAFTRQARTDANSGGTNSGGTGARPGSSEGGGSTGAMAGRGGNGTSTRALLIDDLEDGDSQTLVAGGWWYMQNDRSGVGLAEFGASTSRAGRSTRAVHALGSGFRYWFFVGVDLPGQPNLDATAFTALTFLARTEPSTPAQALSIDLLDTTSVNVMSSTALHFRSSVELSPEWRSFSLPLEDFVPVDGDAALRVNRAELSTVEFWIFSPDPFDFWLDDLGFLP